VRQNKSGLPYVHAYTDRHGKVRRYFRRGSSPKIPLPDNPDSAGFKRAYKEIAAQFEAKKDSIATGVPLPFRRTKIGTERSRVGRATARESVAGVYLLMRLGRIVYVGSSADMAARVLAHRANGRLFDHAYYIAAPGSGRVSLERLLIEALKPPQNTTGVPKREPLKANFGRAAPPVSQSAS
jgi:hypothetical protein